MPRVMHEPLHASLAFSCPQTCALVLLLALPCPALPCPALTRSSLPCPALLCSTLL